MAMRVTDSLIGLDPDQAISLQRQHVQTICCIERQLWLSQEGLADDIVLSPGECVTLRGRGLIVAQSLGDRALFMVKQPASWLSTIRYRGAELIARIVRAKHKVGAT
jgi:hypothetical protein